MGSFLFIAAEKSSLAFRGQFLGNISIFLSVGESSRLFAATLQQPSRKEKL
jgi:hypothetical protein